MRGFAKGVMGALEGADQIDIHFTQDEREGMLSRAYASLERAQRERSGVAEAAGFVEGVKQTAIRLDGHNWTSLNLGGNCLMCDAILEEEV